ncbi:MAG: lipoyl synthase [Epsilonproteobacteria bacterium]|nr:lipoyl synthase [Campylobacterota bacterium]
MKPKVKAPSFELIKHTYKALKANNTNTVCHSSKCPNIAECFERKTATFMILGNVCTRNCRFCNIKSARPKPLDKNEPLNVAKAVNSLNLKYAVITSVDRDDLDDFGSRHFFDTIETINSLNPNTKIEALTPDFQGDINALNLMTASSAYKLAHNIETTQNLHKHLKPKSSYSLSLKVLEYYSKFKITKSSLMVGFGESFEDIKNTLKDLINTGVSQVTIGQYLSPSPKHHPVVKYYSDDEFQSLKALATDLGFKAVACGRLVRSSYYADKL